MAFMTYWKSWASLNETISDHRQSLDLLFFIYAVRNTTENFVAFYFADGYNLD